MKNSFVLFPVIILFGLSIFYWLERPGSAISQTAPAQALRTDTLSLAVMASDTSLSAAPKNRVYSLTAVGDIMMGGRMTPFLTSSGPDYPFVHTAAVIRAADVAIANLEAPLGTEGTPVSGKTYTFLVPPLAAQGIKNAGFDVLSLANNHILDYGKLAFNNTLRLLDSLELKRCGAGPNLDQAREPLYYQLADMKIAFLSFSACQPTDFYATEHKGGVVPAFTYNIEADVRRATETADMTVVSFHWGQELNPQPAAYQMEFGRLAIDAGASIVLGHHPHILQGLERYKQGLIAYSLGNFAFGSYSPNAKTSAILSIYFEKSQLRYAELIPLKVDNFQVDFQSEILTGAAAENVLHELQKLSRPFDTVLEIKNDRGIIMLADDTFGHQ